MNITVTGRHMEITDALKSYAVEKVAKLEKYLPGAEASVTLGVEKYRHKAEIQIKVNGILIQAQDETDEMYASIDKVIDKINRQVKKYRSKLRDRKSRGEGRPMPAGEAEAAEEVGGERIPEIIKTKRFEMKPMTPDEAVMQMELLHKDFFVFSNVATGSLNVIYRRNDGNVGLIEPVS